MPSLHGLRSLLQRASEATAKAIGRIVENFERGRTDVQPSRARRKPRGIGERLWANTLAGGVTFGWPSGWSQDRIEQVLHYKHWFWKASKARGNYMCALPFQMGIVRAGRQPHRGTRDFLGNARWRKTLNTIRPHEEIDEQ